eukprot:8747124-Pyramimonas_sp.AAC.1
MIASNSASTNLATWCRRSLVQNVSPIVFFSPRPPSSSEWWLQSSCTLPWRNDRCVRYTVRGTVPSEVRLDSETMRAGTSGSASKEFPEWRKIR